jgi:hypothetical protein
MREFLSAVEDSVVADRASVELVATIKRLKNEIVKCAFLD